jgi:hypothetical protein
MSARGEAKARSARPCASRQEAEARTLAIGPIYIEADR